MQKKWKPITAAARVHPTASQASLYAGISACLFLVWKWENLSEKLPDLFLKNT